MHRQRSGSYSRKTYKDEENKTERGLIEREPDGESKTERELQVGSENWSAYIALNRNVEG